MKWGLPLHKLEQIAEYQIKGVNLDYGADFTSLGILVELAKNGDIDPWDIDLELVTEKYLQALNNSPSDNLRSAGEAIFYASVLLRMKSDILSEHANEALQIGVTDLSEEILEELNLLNQRQITFRDLEYALQRRNIQKGRRYRTLTLEDLIYALKAARDEEERRIAKINQQKLFDDLLMDTYSIIEPEISDNILELTHAENFEENISKIRAYLSEHLLHDTNVKFEDLVAFLDSWSYALLAVLFLAQENKIKIEQNPLDFYGDPHIYEP